MDEMPTENFRDVVIELIMIISRVYSDAIYENS